MKLYIKQKVFSWSDRFTIWDEQGDERWYAQGEIFSWGRKLHILDAGGREVAFIRQKLLSFLQRYFIEIDNNTYTFVKEFTFLKPRFNLEGVGWTASGDFWAHEYEVSDGPDCIMSLSKKWFTWGDSYELDIPNPENELLGLCVALTIDCMNADSVNAASAGSNSN